MFGADGGCGTGSAVSIEQGTRPWWGPAGQIRVVTAVGTSGSVKTREDKVAGLGQPRRYRIQTTV